MIIYVNEVNVCAGAWPLQYLNLSYLTCFPTYLLSEGHESWNNTISLFLTLLRLVQTCVFVSLCLLDHVCAVATCNRTLTLSAKYKASVLYLYICLVTDTGIV